MGLGFRWVCAAASSHHQHASGAKANEFREEEEEEEERGLKSPFPRLKFFLPPLPPPPLPPPKAAAEAGRPIPCSYSIVQSRRRSEGGGRYCRKSCPTNPPLPHPMHGERRTADPPRSLHTLGLPYCRRLLRPVKKGGSPERQ